MQVAWDYTKLAKGYIKRPDYASDAIDQMLDNLGQPINICDIGAGDGHLTLELAKRDKKVHAVEPNDAMRANGITKTKNCQAVTWSKGTAEVTGEANNTYDAVTFGSSFNVIDQITALVECKRITKDNGGFACMWNHRDLDDPMQKNIETIIIKHIPNYDYGNRRVDQTAFLTSSSMLTDVKFISGHVRHEQGIEECVEAWRSHGTLHRQCKDDDQFDLIIHDIDQYLLSLGKDTITIPYITRIWTAKFI